MNLCNRVKGMTQPCGLTECHLLVNCCLGICIHYLVCQFSSWSYLHWANFILDYRLDFLLCADIITQHSQTHRQIDTRIHTHAHTHTHTHTYTRVRTHTHTHTCAHTHTRVRTHTHTHTETDTCRFCLTKNWARSS